MAARLGGHQQGQSTIQKSGQPLPNESLLIGTADGGQGCGLIEETDAGQRCGLIVGADRNPRWVSDAEFDLSMKPDAKVRHFFFGFWSIIVYTIELCIIYYTGSAKKSEL